MTRYVTFIHKDGIGNCFITNKSSKVTSDTVLKWMDKLEKDLGKKVVILNWKELDDEVSETIADRKSQTS